MRMNDLKRNTPRKLGKYVGRGGKRGKTAGRGTKGQNARAGRKKFPEIREWIKKFPKMRGRGKNSNKSIVDGPYIVSLSGLVGFSGEINPRLLAEAGAVKATGGSLPKVKILGGGKAPAGLKISGCAVSESVRRAIIEAGGSVS